MKKRIICSFVLLVLLVPLLCFAEGKPDIHTYYFLDNPVNFPTKVTAKVYTGPGTDYMRAAGGEAEFISKSFKCGGMDGDWLFARCQVKGGLRYGYIFVGKEQQTVRNIPQMELSSYKAVTKTEIDLWDSLMDNNIGPLCSLKKGTEVTYLCNFVIDRTTLAYVEADYGFQKVRGFTLPEYLSLQNN